MNKLNRFLWTGVVLVGAACGDDVTVAPPPEPPPPGIRAVTVAPDGASIAIGDHLTFTAAVTTDPGAAAPTIAWSSSNTAIATVDANGVATGVAVGSVGIRATATSGTSTGSGVATLNVSNTAVTPARRTSTACVARSAGASPSGRRWCRRHSASGRPSRPGSRSPPRIPLARGNGEPGAIG